MGKRNKLEKDDIDDVFERLGEYRRRPKRTAELYEPGKGKTAHQRATKEQKRGAKIRGSKTDRQK